MSFKSLPPVVSKDPIIRCSKCSHEMRLTESLAGPFVERLKARFKEQLDENAAQLAREREALRLDAAQTEQARLEIDDEVERRLSAERPALAAAEGRKAREAIETVSMERERELSELRDVLRANDQKLAEAQRSRAEVLRQQRELAESRAALELTVEQRIQASLADIRTTARRDSDEAARLRVAERDRTIESMATTIEELKRQAEQGSQRRQGEVQELELERELEAKFPSDVVEPVRNGEAGADIMQRVNGAVGRSAGVIIWESKRTKLWNDAWLGKLRNDQRRCGADVAVIVSQTLPKNINHFDLVEGVWVSHPRCAMSVGIALRQAIMEVDGTRIAQTGQATKSEQLYRYVTGSAFRRRIEVLVEAFDDMRADLEKERKFVSRFWAKREMQIAACIEATVGTVGDLQAIAGNALQTPRLLETEETAGELLKGTGSDL
jgi:hypothetical protein